MVYCQTQLEEIVRVMSQEISTIKQILERLVVPQAPTTTRGETIVKEHYVEQQAAKPTPLGNAASRHRTNSQQLPQSQAKSTYSITLNSRRMHTKAEPSRPHNGVASGPPPRSITQ